MLLICCCTWTAAGWVHGVTSVVPTPCAAGTPAWLQQHSARPIYGVPPNCCTTSELSLSVRLTCGASALGECGGHHVSGQVEVLTQVLNALVRQEPEQQQKPGCSTNSTADT
jgi:hypothetical protein